MNPALPDHKEAESAVIGSLILRPTAIDDVALKIGESDFFDPFHAAAFREILAVQESGKRCDEMILNDRLKKTELYKKSSELPAAYIARAVGTVALASNVNYYADLVREKSIHRKIIFAAENILERAGRNDAEPEQLLELAEQQIFDIREQGRGATQAVPMSQCVQEFHTYLEKLSNSNEIPGVQTGIASIDQMIGSLRPGELSILAARPGVGKTALAGQIAYGAAATKQVLFCSLEMSRLEITSRITSMVSRVNSWNLRTGNVTQEQYGMIVEAASKICQSKLDIDDTPYRTPTEIAALARSMKRKKGLDLLVVDYLNLIHAGRKMERREQEVAHIARRMKLMARDLNIAVLCLCQLNRSTEDSADKRPQLRNLRESGAIEQDADLVMFLHRAEIYNPTNDDLKNKAELIVAKNRNGPVGKCELIWDREHTMFHEPARPVHEHQEAYDAFADYGG